MSAALAYYTLFSLAPLMVISIAIAGLVFGDDAARGAIVDQIQGLIGTDAAHGVQAMLTSARKPRSEERRVGKECRSRWSPYH